MKIHLDSDPITTFRYYNDPSIVAYSRVVLAHGCRPARIVLRKLGAAKWVTHLETLALDGDTFVHDGFHHGHYFEVREDGVTSAEFDRLAGEEYAKAMDDYQQRAKTL